MATDKDKDRDDKAAAEKAAADKKAAEKHEAAERNRIENPDQDPDHPANKTLSPERRPMPRSEAEAFGVPAAELLTEQEKDAAAGGPGAGVGPVSASETTPGPVETIEEQGIGPRTPYPTGSPPPPAESTTWSQGIKGVTDKPAVKPGSSSGPAGKAPELGDRDAAYKANQKKDPVLP